MQRTQTICKYLKDLMFIYAHDQLAMSEDMPFCYVLVSLLFDLAVLVGH